MLQVVKVFVAAGGLLQFAQPSQGNKSQVVKLDAVGKVTVKDDGVSANDDKGHTGASQKLKDGQGIVRT